jgi:hypothetical protein
MRPSSSIHDVMLKIISVTVGHILKSDKRKSQELIFKDILFTNVEVCNKRWRVFWFSFA